ncbi:VanW family protein [Eubacteriales bacterium OttesenSCG-928-N13]|nr:VanW family protein [Eubacteriales bacterium OttesenSCG-928-N13]
MSQKDSSNNKPKPANGGYRRRMAPVDGQLPDLKLRMPSKKTKNTEQRAKARAIPEKHNSRASRRKSKQAWWSTPIAMAMMALLVLLGSFLVVEVKGYADFLVQKNSVTRGTFYPGVSVEGIDLSNMTLDQALSDWGARDQKVRDTLNLTLALGDKTWDVSADSLGYQSNYEQAIMSAWSVGRYGTLEERYQIIGDLTQENWQRDFTVERNIDDTVAMARLTKLADQVSTQPVDAAIETFDVKARKFTFSTSRSGQVVDPKELLQSIHNAAASGASRVEVVRREVQPQITEESIAGEYGKVSATTTDGSFSTANRLSNLKLSCKTLNGYRLEPGEEFSFNTVIGKRTAKAGYKAAGAYENGITTAQLGGGICQVSTTLFNSAVKADMKISERAPHSRPSKYVGLGKDATVNWPNQDFRFINTSDSPIYIIAFVKNKKVTIEIYGKKLPNGMKISLDNKINASYRPGEAQYIKDSKLAPGQQVLYEEARKGYTCTTYKVYLDSNKKELKRVQLCKSYYRPAGAVYKVG